MRRSREVGGKRGVYRVWGLRSRLDRCVAQGKRVVRLLQVRNFGNDVILAEACHDDVDKLNCAEIQPGEGRVHECLRKRRSELSHSCAKEELKLEIQESQNFDMRTSLKKVRRCLHACRMFAKPPSIPPHADPPRRSTPPLIVSFTFTFAASIPRLRAPASHVPPLHSRHLCQPDLHQPIAPCHHTWLVLHDDPSCARVECLFMRRRRRLGEPLWRRPQPARAAYEGAARSCWSSTIPAQASILNTHNRCFIEKGRTRGE